MTRIRVDDALRSKLHNFTEPLEICDDEGNVIAWVEPALDPSFGRTPIREPGLE